ncbi:MAG: carbohydrate ABC transporter permease [Monoglobaceae bacterium]
MKKSIKETCLIYVILSVILLVIIFPLIYTVLASFKTNAEILANPGGIIPKKFSLENYITAWNAEDFNVKRLLLNSIYYTAIITTATVIKGAACGYVFARADFPGKRFIFALFSALLFVHLGTITVYPLFNILNTIKLNRSLWGLILIKVFSINVVNIYMVKSFITSLPKGLDEAATIDGCNFIQTFIYIIAPLLKPVLATVAILAFKNTWNEYLMPTIFTLGNPSQRTLIAGVVALKSGGNAASSWNLMFAGSAIALVPVLIAYAFGNRYFVSGLTAGAVKG